MRRRKAAWLEGAQERLRVEEEAEAPRAASAVDGGAQAVPDRAGPAATAAGGDASVPREAVADGEALKERLRLLFEEGRAVWESFEDQIRQHRFHTFVPGDYECVLRTLVELRGPADRRGRKLRFLELGSATGVIAIMADLLGYEAYGIEIDPQLVEVARALAQDHGPGARFAAGSYLPAGYEWKPADGDGRLGTIGQAEPAYAGLGRHLDYFDLVYAYPWFGEEPILRDVMARHGAPGARLMLHGGEGTVSVYRGGRQEVTRGS